MSPEELLADVDRFVAHLTAKTGVDLNADEVWSDLQERMEQE